MASSPEPRNANDDLDDLFDYDIDEADLQTLDISVPAPRSPPPAATRTGKEDELGLDAEVKVKKARKPTVKLDEKRYDKNCFQLKQRLQLTVEQTSGRARNSETTKRSTETSQI